MTSGELRKKYLQFFKAKGHTIIPSAPLIPENDPTVLFTTAGMHPLVPFLLGEQHPGGKRVANVQKCLRTVDINEVGDNRHLTFFEMLGNWSFGDYFKKEAINWSWEFLTDKKWLGLDPERIYVTVFKGEEGIPRDEESIAIWQSIFKKAGLAGGVADKDETIKKDTRIIPLGVKDNFWIAGQTGPCGGDTEMFYDTRPKEGQPEGRFSDLVNNFRLIEIWNDVFMEFNKTGPRQYEKLAKSNVDTGMGLERTMAALNARENVFATDTFLPLIEEISKISGLKYEGNEKSFRIIADHLKAATFILTEGLEPSNLERGYVLRRLIRRAVRYGKQLGINRTFTFKIAEIVAAIYREDYPELWSAKDFIQEQLVKEEEKFAKTLKRGLRKLKNEIAKIEKEGRGIISSQSAFDLYQTYGFPLELTEELAREKNLKVNKEGFSEELQKHQEISRSGQDQKFKGGLADHSAKVTHYHTATHLLLAALREILGPHVFQKGSNITAARLRFDFSHPEKMAPEQIKKVEDLVNEKIKEDLEVKMEEMTLEEAKKQGTMGVFESRYGERVKVYTIGHPSTRSGQVFSKEICGGPHAKRTSDLGHFEIIKEEASSAGVRRIKAILK